MVAEQKAHDYKQETEDLMKAVRKHDFKNCECKWTLLPEVKKAFEWLSAPERNEGRRHAAVMVLREIAYCMPTFFFQVIRLS